MAYFDFANDTITKDTTLKAKWCCAGSPLPEYDFKGNWFRFTKANGAKYVPATQDEAYMIASTYGVANSTIPMINVETGAAENVKISDIMEIEFGSGWEEYLSSVYGGSNYFFAGAYTGLIKISGYPEGLFENAGSCNGSNYILLFPGVYYGSTGNYTKDIEIDLTLPSSVLANGRTNFWFTYYLFSEGNCTNSSRRVYGKLYFDFSPQDVLDSWNGSGAGLSAFHPQLLSTAGITNGTMLDSARQSASYKYGWGFGGPYAEAWLELFPEIKADGGLSTAGKYSCGSSVQTYYIRNSYTF